MRNTLFIIASACIRISVLAATGEAIKPTWTIAPDKLFASPSSNKTTSAQPLRWTKSGDIVYNIRDSESDLSGLALVDGTSGVVLDTLAFPALPADTIEFLSSSTPMPDGRIVISSVTYRFENEQKGACVQLRVVDPSKKKLKLITHKQMAFDDPASTSGSGVVVWSGQVCVQSYCVDNRVAVVSPYFLIEFDSTSWKPIHGTRMKGGSLNQTLLQTGVIWDVNNKNYFMAKYGGDIREISKEDAIAAHSGKVPFDGYMKSDEHLAKCANGKVEIAERNLAVELPAPADDVFAYPANDSCLVVIRCPEGKEVHCAIHLPKK